jgi:nitroreductase
MDAFLTVASKREVREYSDRPLPDAALQRILDSGRVAGSSRNRQPWRFIAVTDPGLRDKIADCVYAPGNVRGASLVVVVAVSGKGPTTFDAGRAAQNMMLTAWNEGIGSCPNGMPDPEALGELVDLADDERPVTVVSFGYPSRVPNPERHSPEQWIERADRKAFEEVVRRL